MEAPDPVGFLFIITILNWVTIKIQTLRLNCTSFHKKLAKSSVVRNGAAGSRLSIEEVRCVMEQLDDHGMGSDEMRRMFEEAEPGLEEMRDAFYVFDKNGDGFIDAEDLRRVLLELGLIGEGVGVEECEGMISVHDEDGDGMIDFDEFVKIMERRSF